MRHLPLALVLPLAALTALALAGCEKKPPPAGLEATSGPVAITADDKGFKPSSVKLKKGPPATLIFTRTSDDTCATEVVFPQLDIKKDLPLNTPVTITVPTDKEQTLTFQCGMGMYKSKVVVTGT